MTNETYNGWKNKETWLANVWLEEYFQQELQDGNDITAPHIEATIDNMLADTANQWGLFSDLLLAAIGQIDYRELAAAYSKES
jgi:hypothetical protein